MRNTVFRILNSTKPRLRKFIPAQLRQRWATRIAARFLSPDMATLRDLSYCYRLFLHREPDPEGWAGWKNQVEKQFMTLERLTEIFLNCHEFRLRQKTLRQPILLELEGFKIFVRRNDWTIGWVIARDKIWEPHVTREIRALLKPGTVFVDIGANVGYFSLLAAACVGERGRVIAIEANPDNCDLIRQGVRANNFNNVLVYPYAVAEKEQEFILGVDGSNSGIIEMGSNIDEVGLHIQAVTGDSLLKDQPRIDLIKIDIEGAEWRALRGMREVIVRHRPVIFTEFFPALLEKTSGVAPEEYLNALRDLGYACFILPWNGAKSETAQNNQQIMAYWSQLADSEAHLDLVAHPGG